VELEELSNEAPARLHDEVQRLARMKVQCLPGQSNTTWFDRKVIMSVVPNLPRQTDTGKRIEPVDQPPAVVRTLSGALTPEQLEVRRLNRLARWSQIITLGFVILESAVLFRVALKLIAANPGSPFAQFMYQITGPFLAPFAGLTAAPAVNGSVLEIPAIIAMAAYGVLYVIIIRSMWVIFHPAKAVDAAKYEPDL
jgi:hypothetical protein